MRSLAGFNPLDAAGPGSARGLACFLAASLLVLAAQLPVDSAAAPPSAQEPGRRPDTPSLLMDRLEATFSARDREGALKLFDFEDEESRALATEELATVFGAEDVQLTLQRPSRLMTDQSRVRVTGQVFNATGPRARVDQWRFTLDKRRDGWAVTAREDLGEVDGLIQLSMDPRAYRADGLTLKLEDFTLRFRKGTLFTSPENLGPTLLVFVGEGEVLVSPRPLAEREQLRRFAGQPELRSEVRSAFIRIHPADLHRVLEPARFEPDPAGAQRLPAAERVFRAQSQRYFILDAPLPRAPWWLLPSVGDASVTFLTHKQGELTFAVSSSEAEDLSLFDRARKRQICLYPSGGREPRYSEDGARAFDLLHMDLSARFEPARRFLSGEATLRLRLLLPASTLRLRLDDSFQVESVTSVEGGRHLFFRVRGQNSLMIPLGPLTGAPGEIALTVRYSGVHEPTPVEQEVLQSGGAREPGRVQDGLFLEGVLVYTNRTAWYPRPGLDDHATALLRFNVPLGLSAVTGGERLSARVEGQRTLVEYRQARPAKYVTAAVGRFFEAGALDEGPLHLRAFGLARTRDDAHGLLERSARILRFYGDQFGPCPYPDLSLLLIEGDTPGGHAPPGMVLLQRRPPLLRHPLRDDPASFPDEPDFFLAHELAHQWFGQAVSGANYRERWLSEGFAQYAAALWTREERGEAAFQDVLARFGRWARRYDAEGPINLGYRVGHLRNDAQAYRAVVYDKAAYVLHMLRGVVGDGPFFQGLHAYQDAHRFGKAGTDDLREALQAAAGIDLTAYFRAWVLGNGVARLRYRSLVSVGGKGHVVALEVEALDLPGPVPVQVRLDHGGGGETRTFHVSPGPNRLTFDLSQRPRRIELNFDRALLARVEGS